MRICLVGDFSAPDEARKVMAHYLSKELSKNNEIRPFDVHDILSINSWSDINSFDPHMIHYIPGASTLSFLITKMMKIRSKNAKTVMFSALHAFHGFSYGPYYGLSSLTKNFMPIIKADQVLVQSDEAERIFSGLGCNVKFLVCSGVDTEKFCPVSENKKRELRAKYGVDAEKFIVLHVGSVRKWRNVGILKEIQKNPDIQVVLVGRTSTKAEKDVALELKRLSVKIINEYTPEIEEIYALSDCYVFPTTDPVGSIDIPLSVLEAMATNLPVVSTRFGGLPRIFGERDGLFFIEKEKDITKAIEVIKNNDIEIKTRKKVLSYSWENIAKKLEEIYEELLR